MTPRREPRKDEDGRRPPDESESGAIGGVATVARTVLVRPGLWWVAVCQAVRLARPRWWSGDRRIPAPSEDLWHLRMLTAYGGDGTSEPDPGDIVSYLCWCRQAKEWRRR